ncbi:MAG: hypothetical protein HC890_19095 [Chloroflexaceae bacterium]|nr:hypothetical protein [Chloroflexaceae bacterium]
MAAYSPLDASHRFLLIIMNEAAIAKTLSDACRDPNLLLAVSWQGPTLQVQVTRLPESQPNWEALVKAWDFALLQLRLPEIQSVVFSSSVEGSEVIDWERRLELAPPPPPVSLEVASKASQLDLSSYCFTRNLPLLSADLPAPSEKIAKLVLFLHELSAAGKEQFLPVLDQCFKNPEERLPTLPGPMQEQIEEIRRLEPEPWRRAGIWLSRYCYDPETTMTQLSPVLAPHALATPAAPAPSAAPAPELSLPQPASEVASPKPVILPERQRQILAIAAMRRCGFSGGRC